MGTLVDSLDASWAETVCVCVTRAATKPKANEMPIATINGTAPLTQRTTIGVNSATISPASAAKPGPASNPHRWILRCVGPSMGSVLQA